MKCKHLFTSCFLAVGFLSSQTLAADFIPQPSSVKLNASKTNIKSVHVSAGADLSFEKSYLEKQLTKFGADTKGAIRISLNLSKNLGGNDYRIVVDPRGIIVQGKDSASVFYALQTLLQMVEIKDGKAHLELAQGKITDKARFGWRGLMLDSSRHFQTVEEVKHFIEMMARYKLNVFHWHLTDDQGWRIEIKSHPKLTSVGAWRVPREGIWWHRPAPKAGEKATYGGFYTQEQIKEVIRFAKERHVQVVPEIDVPGHAMAILSAYPELSTTKGPFQVNPGSPFWNKVENTLDPSNPKTYELLEDIFAEVAVLFPSQYIHIGGDECTKFFWNRDQGCKDFMKKQGLKNAEDLQSYFIKRCEKMLSRHGKKIMGWDEILEGGLAKSATVMSWRGVSGADKASKQGNDVIIASNSAYYFDLYQGHPEYEPATYSKCRLSQSYRFDYNLPEGVDSKKLLGFHGCLWTEEVPNMRHAQYMLWPRGFALAEAAWSTNTKKNWPKFVSKVESHFQRFDYFDVNYAKSIYDPMIKTFKKDGRDFIKLSTEIDGLDIHYTFDEGEVDHHYPVYKNALLVPYGATTINVKTYRDGKPVGKLRKIVLSNINKPKKVLFPTPL